MFFFSPSRVPHLYQQISSPPPVKIEGLVSADWMPLIHEGHTFRLLSFAQTLICFLVTFTVGSQVRCAFITSLIFPVSCWAVTEMQKRECEWWHKSRSFQVFALFGSTAGIIHFDSPGVSRWKWQKKKSLTSSLHLSLYRSEGQVVSGLFSFTW